MKKLPYGPLCSFLDSSILGKYSDAYIVDSISDFEILKEASTTLKVDLPLCIVVAFEQEKYSMWQQVLPNLDADLPAVVCNTLLDCYDDDCRFDVSCYNMIMRNIVYFQYSKKSFSLCNFQRQLVFIRILKMNSE